MRKQGEKINAPFYALTAQELKTWYKERMITASGYLFSIKNILTPPGKKFTIPSVVNFCEEWGISRSAFYKAVNELTAKGYLSWRATHGIILTDSDKVVPIPASPTSGQVSPIVDSDSTNVDNVSPIVDSDIYIDRARDQSITDINRDIQSGVEEEPHPHTQKKQPSEMGEEEPCQHHSTIDIKATNLSRVNSESLVEDNIPVGQPGVITTLSKKYDSHLEELTAKLERGELSDLPLNEKKQLANYLMGDRIAQYRRSGWILGVKPNDISPDFLKYVAWKELKQPNDLDWARNTVISYERNMTKWGQLAELVQGWEEMTPEKLAEIAASRVANKSGTAEDFKIAIQANSRERGKKYNPFLRKNIAKYHHD